MPSCQSWSGGLIVHSHTVETELLEPDRSRSGAAGGDRAASATCRSKSIPSVRWWAMPPTWTNPNKEISLLWLITKAGTGAKRLRRLTIYRRYFALAF